MGKRRFTEDGWRRDPWFRALASALLQCKTQEEIADFLRDIGTLSELQAWSERLEVAKQLAKGLSYRQVAANTGASTTTVTRVAKFLENGEGGYRKFLKAHRHHRAGQTPDVSSYQDLVKERNAQEGESKPTSRGSGSMLQRYLGGSRKQS